MHINEKTIERLEISFIIEDKKEPFINREYVKETKRIFKLLKSGIIGSEQDVTDRAIYDIVNDIFHHFEETKGHIPIE